MKVFENQNLKSNKEEKFILHKKLKTGNDKINKIKYINKMKTSNYNNKYKNKLYTRNNKYFTNILYNYNLIIIFIYDIIIIPNIFFPPTLLKNINLRKLNLNSEITIIVGKTESQYILSDESVQISGKTCKFDNLPSEIIVNDNQVEEIGKIIYNLNNEENTIVMRWNYEITDCCGMFYNLPNIINIDLSNFDSSSIEDMRGMFFNCISLTSLNLNNFNTSSVTNMASMFQECEKLTSLDLSSFDTSLVTDMNNMFYNCKIMQYLDLQNFNTSYVTNMESLFFGCSSLETLDLNNFDTSSVINIKSMFEECTSLKSINIDNFNTKKMKHMSRLFFNCRSLTSINLKSFDTSNVIEMSCMFYDCRALTSLNLKNFNTSSNTWMDSMFYGCMALTSLDLRNFDTSLITWMNGLFSYCYSLEYLDISSFDTSKVVRMDAMFLDCRSLKYLNLYNFDTSKVTRMDNLLNGCSSLIAVNLSSFDTSNVENMNYMFTNCISLVSLNLINFDTFLVPAEIDIFNGCNSSLKYCIDDGKASKIMLGLSEFNNFDCNDNCFIYSPSQLIPEKYSCIDLCSNDDEYKFEYKNVCYKSCPTGTHNSSEKEFLCEEDLICDNYYNYDYTGCIDVIPEGYYLNNSVLKTIDKCDIKCKSCSFESVKYNLCIVCNNDENYYSKYNDSSNIDSFTNCFNEDFDGYYLNSNTKRYEYCYPSCKKCTQLGDESLNHCTECYSNYSLNNSNCLKTMDFIDDSSLDSYSDEISNPINILSYEISGFVSEKEFSEYFSTEDSSINSNNISNFKLIIDNFINNFIILKNISNASIYYYEMNFEGNMDKNKYNNVTYIDFPPDTKEFLYNQFNLEKDKDKIYILIIDYLISNLNSATSDYEYKFLLENGTELNLSNIKEDYYYDIYAPILDLILSKFNYSIFFTEQGYDIYDIKGKFYQDECSSAYLNESDIILKDRKEDIYPNNVTFCKDNCEYKSINIEEKRIVCKCNLNINSNILNQDNFFSVEKNNFFNYLYDYINYKIFKCYKLLLVFDNLKKNAFFYIVLIIFIIIICVNIIFYIFGIRNIRKMAMKHIPSQINIKIKIIKELQNLKNKKDENLNLKRKNQTNKPFQRVSKKKYKTMKQNKSRILNKIEKEDSTNIKMLKKQKDPEINIYNNRDIKSENIKDEIIIQKKEDINNLPFSQAIIKDKRNFFQIFLSVIFQKLDLINLIFGDNRVKIILVYQYILSLLIDFFFNTFLFSDQAVSIYFIFINRFLF